MSLGTFRPDRIRSIAERFGVDGSMALENILYGIVSALKILLGRANCFTLARAFNSEHQVDLPFFLVGALVIHYLSDGTYQ